MKILIIDNYDSFTYNLYQYLGEILTDKGEGFKIDVFKNDAISIEEIKNKKYDKIVISPGPGNPNDEEYFGISAEVIRKMGKTIPVFGVCLGFQGIGLEFGGKIERAKLPMHGKTSKISHSADELFENIPQDIEVMRYHSLVVKLSDEVKELKILARSEDDGEIMAFKHKNFPIFGVQFHPESFATEGGKQILINFLNK